MEVGAEVVKLGVDPDGFNMNIAARPRQAIDSKVSEVRADIGIALDGDADRVVIVDEKGQMIDGDQPKIGHHRGDDAATGKAPAPQPGLAMTAMS